MLENRKTRRIIYFIIASVGTVLLLINTWNYGIGLTEDSISYIYSGSNLFKLMGFYNYDGSTFINWPPFYPFIIFLLSLIGKDINPLMLFFNIILFFITILIIGKLAEHIFTVHSIKIIYTATLALSFQMLFIYVRVWSESVFITLIAFSILLIIQKNGKSNNISILILLSLCLLTRYIGLSLIIAYYLYEVFQKAETNTGKYMHYIKPLLGSLLAILPALIWFVRNMYVSRSITGVHFGTFETTSNIVFKLLSSISSLFIPESVNVNIRIILFAVLLSALIIIYIKNRIYTKFIKLLLLVFFFYSLILIIVQGILKIDEISLRFVLPVYFILLVFQIYAFDYLINKSSKVVTKRILFSVLFLTILFPVEKGIKHSYINFTNGIDGFNSKKWKDSETIKLVKKDFGDSRIYSNSVAGIYANTGKETKKISEYYKDSSNQAILIIFNKFLPVIDLYPVLSRISSAKDSTLHLVDSYIIIKKTIK